MPTCTHVPGDIVSTCLRRRQVTSNQVDSCWRVRQCGPNEAFKTWCKTRQTLPFHLTELWSEERPPPPSSPPVTMLRSSHNSFVNATAQCDNFSLRVCSVALWPIESQPRRLLHCPSRSCSRVIPYLRLGATNHWGWQ